MSILSSKVDQHSRPRTSRIKHDNSNLFEIFWFAFQKISTYGFDITNLIFIQVCLQKLKSSLIPLNSPHSPSSTKILSQLDSFIARRSACINNIKLYFIIAIVFFSIIYRLRQTLEEKVRWQIATETLYNTCSIRAQVRIRCGKGWIFWLGNVEEIGYYWIDRISG